jgi:hypothetical protein
MVEPTQVLATRKCRTCRKEHHWSVPWCSKKCEVDNILTVANILESLLTAKKTSSHRNEK